MTIFFGDNIGKGDSSISNLSRDFKCLESSKHSIDIPIRQGDRLKLGSEFRFYLLHFVANVFSKAASSVCNAAGPIL